MKLPRNQEIDAAGSRWDDANREMILAHFALERHMSSVVHGALGDELLGTVVMRGLRGALPLIERNSNAAANLLAAGKHLLSIAEREGL